MSDRHDGEPKSPTQLTRLLGVIARLRAPGGCPWDREQTELTMAPHLLEETFEAVDAVQRGDPAAVCEELGDVLMNVLMIAQIASEAGKFDSEAVACAIADKLVRRHPHVFGSVRADDTAAVLANWEAIKRQERQGDDSAAQDGVLSGVPAALPALLKAFRIGEKAARVGFDWPDRRGPRDKVDEELRELDEAIAAGDETAVHSEFGDLLFSVANLARHHGVNPEMALRATVDRFIGRFRHVEETLGERLAVASLAEKEALWQESKRGRWGD